MSFPQNTVGNGESPTLTKQINTKPNKQQTIVLPSRAHQKIHRHQTHWQTAQSLHQNHNKTQRHQTTNHNPASQKAGVQSLNLKKVITTIKSGIAD